MAGGRWDAGQGPAGGDLIGPNPTDRGQPGTKKSVLVEATGGPLVSVVAGANVHDPTLLAATLDAVIVPRPLPTPEEPRHLCLDKAYDKPTGEAAVLAHGSTPHRRRIGEERIATEQRTSPPRRWVVERTRAWLSKCRAILVRYDKRAANYRALLTYACVLLWYRRYHRLAVLR